MADACSKCHGTGFAIRTDEAGVLFGEGRLPPRLQELDVSDPEGIVKELLADVADHTGSDKPKDDQTLFVLHHNAEDPPRQSLGQKLATMAKMLGLIRSSP